MPKKGSVQIFHELRNKAHKKFQHDSQFYHDKINEFFLNVILVLKGGRQCYKMHVDRHLRKYLLKSIDKISKNKLSIIHSKEPIIYLTNNTQLGTEIKNTQKFNSQCLGEFLGYCYTNDDFADYNLDRYMIVPTAVDQNNVAVQLYRTMVPQAAFNETVKAKITKINCLLNETLRPFGYLVKTAIYNSPPLHIKLLQCKDQSYDVKDDTMTEDLSPKLLDND